MSGGVYIDCGSSCSVSCGSDCSNACSDEPACLESKPAFSLPQQANLEIEAACARAVERDQVCAESVIAVGCEHWARVERPEVVASYACISESACGGDVEPCKPPAGTLGDELCDAGTAACGHEVCEPEFRDQFNRNSGWLRDDVADALRTCFSGPCSFQEQCVNAWWAAVYPVNLQ